MTSQLQQQDFVVFSDGQILPERRLSGESTLTVITHIQGTSPSWLLTGLAEDSLLGTCHYGPGIVSTKHYSATIPKTGVVLASFFHDASFYSKAWKKHLGQDIINTRGNAVFVNMMDELLKSGVKPQSLFDKVFVEAQRLARRGTRPTVIIESPELVISVLDCSADELMLQIHSLNKIANVTVVTTTDSPLVRGTHGELVAKLLHRASVVIDLHPLETGYAHDATGLISVRRGAVPMEGVQEKEYLYLLNKEGTVRLFFK